MFIFLYIHEVSNNYNIKYFVKWWILKQPILSSVRIQVAWEIV